MIPLSGCSAGNPGQGLGGIWAPAQKRRHTVGLGSFVATDPAAFRCGGCCRDSSRSI